MMKTPPHTAGPWQIREDGAFFRIVEAESKATVASGISNEGKAHILAAAPELLEALDAAQTELFFCQMQLAAYGHKSRKGGSVQRALDKSRAAIAKAKGQA